jgi:hypothetical protein
MKKLILMLLSLAVLTVPFTVFAEEGKQIATFDVTNGFEKEVQFDSLTTLEWTFMKGDASHLFTMDLPGKQLPATKWKAFYKELGWDTARINEMEVTFSDDTTAILYAKVIGNSGKVRFWMEPQEETMVTEENKKTEKKIESPKESNNQMNKKIDGSFKLLIPQKDGRTISNTVELTFEWINNVSVTNYTWYIWINNSQEPIKTENMSYTLTELSPGTHLVKVELRNEQGEIIDETQETFIVPTEDGGVLPNTATPWPNLMFAGVILSMIGAALRVKMKSIQGL